MNMGGSASFHYDDVTSEQGQSIVHALLGWPDLGFGMPPAPSVGAPETVSSQGPAPSMTGTKDRPEVADQALPDLSGINWSTWDEFVLDTYADSTPKSRFLGK